MQRLLGPLLSRLPPGTRSTSPAPVLPAPDHGPVHNGLGVAFAFAIAANVIAAIASLLTGRRKRAAARPEPLGSELAAVAAEGGIEPSKLVAPQVAQEAAARAAEPGANGQTQAIAEPGGKTTTDSGRKRPG